MEDSGIGGRKGRCGKKGQKLKEGGGVEGRE